MKKVIYILMLLFSLTSFSQKKKSISSKSFTAVAEIDNLVVEIKNKAFQITINEKGKAIETIKLKEVDVNFVPLNSKITSFIASGTKLYFLSWEEKSITKTLTKSEDVTIINSKIFEVKNKKELFSNSKTITKITEQVFLDKNKTASETQEKIRNEGYDFALNSAGNILLKSKKLEKKWTFDVSKNEFVEISNSKK